MTHILTLIPTQGTFRLTFPPSMPIPNSSFRPCVPDLNLNKSLLPASHIPCKYFLNLIKICLHYKIHFKMKALKCKPSALFAYSYSINILSKYSSLISHRPSIFEGRHIYYRSSKVDTSITDLRRSTHRSSFFEGQHIHLRKSTHRSPKVDTS